MLRLLDLAVLSFQATISGTILVGIRRGNLAAAVNGGVALAAALLPVLAFDGVALGSPLSVWIAIAGVLHCLGMLGFYESVWWWDHVTHTISAGLVAALLYAAFLAPPNTSRLSVATATVLLTLGVGVLWELVELVARDVGERFDVDPVLVHYGWRDTGFDLLFDGLAAVLIVALDVRLFVPIVSAVPGVTGTALLWGVGLVVGGSLLLSLVLVGIGG